MIHYIGKYLFHMQPAGELYIAGNFMESETTQHQTPKTAGINIYII